MDSTAVFLGTVLVLGVVAGSSTGAVTARVLLVARVGGTRWVADGVADAFGGRTRPVPFCGVSNPFLERVAISFYSPIPNEPGSKFWLGYKVVNVPICYFGRDQDLVNTVNGKLHSFRHLSG